MFQIDRSYIDHISLESLQSRIWDIRTDFKDDPTLPQISTYGIKEKDFEDYLERKQHYEDFKDSWRSRRLFILAVAFILPVALFSLFMPHGTKPWLAYLAAFLVCALVALVYATISMIRGSKFRDNPYEKFINALLIWDEQRKTK